MKEHPKERTYEGITMETTTTIYRCFHCSGRGRIARHYPDRSGRIRRHWQPCDHCRGTGQYVYRDPGPMRAGTSPS